MNRQQFHSKSKQETIFYLVNSCHCASTTVESQHWGRHYSDRHMGSVISV